MMAGHFMGMKVILHEDRPKLQLSKNVPVTDEFRADFDAWALRFFGVTNDVPDGEVRMLGQHTMVLNPRSYAALRQAAKPAPRDPMAFAWQGGPAWPRF